MNTIDQHKAIKNAFDYFNTVLFNGELPEVFFNFSRKKNTAGFYAPGRWGERDSDNYDIPEISLTPTSLIQTPKEVYSTLVHEMCHHWQWVFGKPSRNGYHNRQWVEKMEQVGLIPSDTGQPGGKQTGQKMSDYIEEGGRFERAFDEMPKEFILPFVCNEGNAVSQNRPKSRGKTKYSCSCGKNVWGKPDLSLICGECEERFEPEP